MVSKELRKMIGERVQVVDETEIGVVTRIDEERGLIHVLFKRMREEAYPFPEAIEQELIKLYK